MFVILSFYVCHRIFRPVNCMPGKCYIRLFHHKSMRIWVYILWINFAKKNLWHSLWKNTAAWKKYTTIVFWKRTSPLYLCPTFYLLYLLYVLYFLYVLYLLYVFLLFIHFVLFIRFILFTSWLLVCPTFYRLGKSSSQSALSPDSAS